MFLKEADLIMAAVMILIVVIGLLMMRRVKKDVVEPLIREQQHPVHIQVLYPTPHMRVGYPDLPARDVRGLPAGDVVEGEFREL